MGCYREEGAKEKSSFIFHTNDPSCFESKIRRDMVE